MKTPTVLILPGWQNSGPTHWQSLWQQQAGYVRVEQHDWLRPLRGDWITRLEDVVLSVDAPVVLVAHSLGCQLVAAWAGISHHTQRVKGALLVAAADVACAELREVLPSWSPLVLKRLPFPSTLVLSQDDPYCSLERSHEFAQTWGSTVVNIGAAGHINADAGLGDWPQGHALLQHIISISDEPKGASW